MIKHIFFDLDDTIFDFHKAEQIALKKTLEYFGAPSDADILNKYHEINIAHWKRLERGELTREQVKVGRYETLFREIGINNIDARAVTKYYESMLAIGHYFIDGAPQMLDSLFQKYSLYLVSNGAKEVQDSRLRSSGIEKYFKAIFISETVGFDKPDKRFFEKCFSQIPDFNKSEAIIIGDSLTSDVSGGKNCGIKTVWFNSNNAENGTEIAPDFEIYSLNEVFPLLERINA